MWLIKQCCACKTVFNISRRSSWCQAWRQMRSSIPEDEGCLGRRSDVDDQPENQRRGALWGCGRTLRPATRTFLFLPLHVHAPLERLRGLLYRAPYGGVLSASGHTTCGKHLRRAERTHCTPYPGKPWACFDSQRPAYVLQWEQSGGQL